MNNVRLELVWPNKDKFLLSPSDESGKPVWVERTHPAAHEVRLTQFVDAFGDVHDDRPEADNLLFVGDSLDVLRVLNETPAFRREYRGKVKLIYIDPPFNTSKSFTHYDDWMEHSTWLSFMRERLLLLRDLLSVDGSIWVHLDDVEQHRMRMLLDEVMGASNFVADVTWRSTDSSSNNTKGFAKDHNSIVVYGKSQGWRPNLLKDPAKTGHYKNPDNDPRGPWFDGRDVQNPKIRPNLQYDVISPSGKVVKHPPNGWRWSRETLMEKLSTGECYFNESETAIKRKTYLADLEGLPPSDIWFSVEQTGSTRQSKNHLKALFPGILTPDLFDTPKPEQLMQKVISLSTQPGDIVVDAFGGSGSTAAAAHKLGRRWVLSEISPNTVATFTTVRLRKVIQGEDSGGISQTAGWHGGGGFRLVQIKPSFYVSTPLGVMLTDEAQGPEYARAVAGQLGFDWEPGDGHLCGRRGRMRLAVVDGPVGVEEAAQIVSELGPDERVTIVARSIMAGVDEWLTANSRGSVCLKTPTDILKERRQRRRRGGDNA